MSIPDVKIFPHATGEAAMTVEKHQDPQDLVFYSGWFFPFVQRTWISLEEKGIHYQYKEISPYKKEKHFLDINPKGLVPAIEHNGKALYESLVLCEFLEDEYPDHQPSLLPAEPFERAYARIWIDFISKNVVSAFFRLLQAQTPDARQKALEDFNQALRTYAEKVKGPYFFGEQFSLVDVAIAPWIVRDYLVQENRGYDRVAVSAAWKTYADTVHRRDGIRRTQSNKEHYAEIYARYLRDEAQSEAAKATREGRPIP